MGWLTRYRRNFAGLVGTAVAANSWIFGVSKIREEVSSGASPRSSQGGRVESGGDGGWLETPVTETAAWEKRQGRVGGLIRVAWVSVKLALKIACNDSTPQEESNRRQKLPL